jgi:hypothetical protein
VPDPAIEPPFNDETRLQGQTQIPANEPPLNSAQVAEIRRVLRHAHNLVVDASLPEGSNHVPESVMPVLDAISDAMREVTARGK